MVAIRKTVPSTIRTKGPARERRRGGGGTTGGTLGVMSELDMVHLARRGRLLRVGRWLRRRDIRWNWWRKILWNTGAECREAEGRRVRSTKNLPCISLTTPITSRMAGQVLPKPTRETLSSRKKHAQCNQHCWTHELAGAAALALARSRTAADQSPLLGKEPDTEKDQDERPETIETELKESGSVQQEEHTPGQSEWQLRQDLGAFEFLAGAKGLCQAEWVRGRLAQLDCLGAANRVK